MAGAVVIPICLISGTSGSGKTTLIERLLPALATRGVRCATVKHHRGEVPVDTPGKDTWRHREAGAAATFFVTGRQLTLFSDCPPDVRPSDLVRLCPPEVRLLLVEGFKTLRGYPRIEVIRRGLERKLTCAEETLCVATDIEDLEAPCAVLGLDDADGIADLLVRRLLFGSS